ncbi:hypothetical protein CKAN_02765100 [Cinnamomum micranthum f. kanehirae]|uniref:Uncharacterized protein n=1 Tax=Cinnamomum micranthum f. kanehirae TaxID=337451 RepID=A0A3S3P0M1_9MAGN|nr:hypothetical protein CKAN_02765100 [Cinnamomum micranthum f. kanehirae]
MAPAHQLVEKDGGLRFKSLRFGDYMKLQQTIVSEGKHALKTLAFQQTLLLCHLNRRMREQLNKIKVINLIMLSTGLQL